jgi:hypothetical protein
MCSAVEEEKTALRFNFEVTGLTRNVEEHKQKCAEKTRENAPRHSARRTEVEETVGDSEPEICRVGNRKLSANYMFYIVKFS